MTTPSIKVTMLGCGTSSGVPKVGNDWGVCDPDEPRNRRRRSSVLVESATTSVVIDTTPDFREQALAANITKLDAVLYTHDHADHMHGIDDLRFLAYRAKQKVPLYGNARTLEGLTSRFAYIFREKSGYPAIATAHEFNGPFQVGDLWIQPFEQQHGSIISVGFRIGDFAYSTDLNALPDAAFETLEGIKYWIVDALRPDPHPTHTHLAQTLEWVAAVKPDRAILTHMNQDMDYRSLLESLPAGVEPGYDGLILTV